MKTKQEVLDIVQEELDNYDEIDLLYCIYNCDELNEKEKEWASANLGVSIVVVKM